MLTLSPHPQITWQKLPADFPLPDDPVDNIAQPLLAAALSESLDLAGLLPPNALTFTNYAVCATLEGKFVVKAPDWGYVAAVSVPLADVNRSYTPRLDGQIPTIVMEFLSDTDGGEYSSKPTYPPGKWYFYERILEVPTYAIFDIATGNLEVYRLGSQGAYELQPRDPSNLYFIPEMNLSLGVWSGTWQNRTGSWLRWWDREGLMLLWGSERVEQERERVEQARQQAEQARQQAEQACQQAEQAQQQAEQLRMQLRAAGLDPEV